MQQALYQKNITEFAARQIQNVHLPKNQQEVIDLLKMANLKANPVHPISTGHNWGLGSKLPVTDADIIDMKNLNRIIEVNEELCYARIEPGVTQRQLCDYLSAHHLDLVLNITGSDSGSSILANCLERGSGKSGHRAEDIRELKVVTPSGSVVKTGFGHHNEHLGKSFYKYGLGPDLTHLFTQSSLGIVLEGVINLLPREPFCLFLVKFKFDDLGQILGGLAEAARKGWINHSVELDSHNDPKIYELFKTQQIEPDQWIGWFMIPGERALRAEKQNLLFKLIKGYLTDCKQYHSEDTNKNCPIPVKVRLERYHGIPSDHSLTASAEAFGVQLIGADIDIDLYDQVPGFRCVLPVIPYGKSSAAYIQQIIEYSEAVGQKPAISIISINNYSLEVFVRVYFNRSDSNQVATCAAWAKGLLQMLTSLEIYPYRIDVDNMKEMMNKMQSDYTELIKEFKKITDPNNILSPNRYIV